MWPREEIRKCCPRRLRLAGEMRKWGILSWLLLALTPVISAFAGGENAKFCPPAFRGGRKEKCITPVSGLKPAIFPLHFFRGPKGKPATTTTRRVLHFAAGPLRGRQARNISIHFFLSNRSIAEEPRHPSKYPNFQLRGQPQATAAKFPVSLRLRRHPIPVHPGL